MESKLQSKHDGGPLSNRKIFGTIIETLLFLSPIVGLILNTVRAVSGGYSADYIQDPGHKTIKFLDSLFAVGALAVGIYIVFFAQDLGSSSISSNVDTVRIFLFPQLSGWTAFIVLYSCSSLLIWYGRQRASIIRKINEKKGVW